MKRLSDIIKNLNIISFNGDRHIIINSIKINSSLVEKNDLFIAIKGTNTDGHKYIDDAVKKGASAIIYSDKCNEYQNTSTIRVKNTSEALAIVASDFYDNPSKKLKIIGITGTNGKTTIATTLYKLFNSLGHKAGLISTIENYAGDKIFPTKLTTPDALELHRLFKKMLDENCEYVFMEVSSHAIAQKRIFNINFDAAVFTNITHDHLDFHHSFKNYLDTKKILFDKLNKNAFALTNIDDKNGYYIVQNTNAKIFTYSLKTIADFKAKILEKHFDATLVDFNNNEFWLQFVGTFNVYNLLAVYAIALLFLKDNNKIITNLSSLKPVRGRFEIIKAKEIYAIIDYAHTPDALKNILKEIKEIKNSKQKIITIIGAGGDRDKTKRPEMANIAAQYSDTLIITSDNPRSEKPENILNDMEKGLENYPDYLKITDRRQAIKTAVKIAQKNDIILIAGKGHETYQEINGHRYHFDDKEEIENLLNH